MAIIDIDLSNFSQDDLINHLKEDGYLVIGDGHIILSVIYQSIISGDTGKALEDMHDLCRTVLGKTL